MIIHMSTVKQNPQTDRTINAQKIRFSTEIYVSFDNNKICSYSYDDT